MPVSWYSHCGKRSIDLLFSAFGLMILSPVILILSVCVSVSAPGPVFFVQERMGRQGKPFLLYKFRTMIVGAPMKGAAVTVKGDPRITKIGRFLRKTKLDELPQLWNVLKGDMSLVGPRPEVKKYVECYPNEYRSILKIRPGITDLAAIEFRNEEDILSQYEDTEHAYIHHVLPQKIKLYHLYIEKMSFIFDFSLVFKTIGSILAK